MQYIFMVLMGLGIVAADQLSKLWILGNIPLYEQQKENPSLGQEGLEEPLQGPHPQLTERTRGVCGPDTRPGLGFRAFPSL